MSPISVLPRPHRTRHWTCWLALFWLACLPGTTWGQPPDGGLDDALATDLRHRLRQVEGLEQVRVSVDAGMVTLAGPVLRESLRDEAMALAREGEGVAGVRDELEVVVDPWQRLRPAISEAVERIQVLISYLPLLLVSLILVAAFFWLSRWIGRRERLFARLSPNRFAQDLVRQVVRTAVLLVGILIALEILDATALVGAVLGAAGVVGLALGFAFRDLVENYIASVLLSVRQPFAPHDLVSIDGRMGKVVRLTSRATILMTTDGNHLRIPNAQVFKGIILNYSRNPLRRFDFAVGVGYGEDLLAAQELGLDVLRGLPGILPEPAPSALIEALADSHVSIRFYGWLNQQESSFGKVKGEAIRRVKGALEQAGMDLPEPIYRVRMVEGASGEAAKPRPAADAAGQPPADIQPEDPLGQQIARDRQGSDSAEDFLDSAAPVE